LTLQLNYYEQRWLLTLAGEHAMNWTLLGKVQGSVELQEYLRRDTIF